MELRDRADNITNLLLTHPDLDKNRPIIFVTHSMGGLLVKHILRRALSGDYPNAESLVKQTKGIVFLSTPHRGANLANFIEHLAFLLPNDNVSELKEDEPTLIDLNNWFITNFERLNLQVQVFCENNPTPVRRNAVGKIFRKIVVDQDSANLTLPGVSVTRLDKDHSSICWVESYQFRKQREQLYMNVLSFIEQINSETSNPMPEPISPQPSASVNIRELRRKLKNLNPGDFNDLIANLEVPNRFIPPPPAPLGDRVDALWNWVRSETGCGLERLQQEVDHL